MGPNPVLLVWMRVGFLSKVTFQGWRQEDEPLAKVFPTQVQLNLVGASEQGWGWSLLRGENLPRGSQPV